MKVKKIQLLEKKRLKVMTIFSMTSLQIYILSASFILVKYCANINPALASLFLIKENLFAAFWELLKL